MILKGYFYVWGLSVDLVYPGSLVVMAVVIVDTSHIFPQSVLAAITLIRSMIGVGEAKAQAQSVSRTFCLLSGCHFLSGLRSAPHIWWNRCPEGQTEIDYILFKCVFSSPCPEAFAPKEGSSCSECGLCTFRGLMHSLCRHLWLHSDAIQGHIFSLLGLFQI